MEVVGDKQPKGKGEIVVDSHLLPSSSNGSRSKSFKEAIIVKISPTHVSFESDDKKSFEDDSLMEE